MNQDIYEMIMQGLATGTATPSVDQLAEMLAPITIGLRQSVPLLRAGARLFRVTTWCGKPTRLPEIGAPPEAQSRLGRLNAQSQSVLYLADSPDTAFAEARVASGEFCISEWRVTPDRMALANGGIPHSVLKARFGDSAESPRTMDLGVEDAEAMNLLQQIFTQQADSAPERYHWSIAGGLACGFAPRCERIEVQEREGNTIWNGRWPFSGIAYVSVRTDKPAVNFAFNDLGQTHLRVENVQWVSRASDGSFTGLDFSSSWNDAGTIQWSKRPARLAVPSGCAARLLKTAPTVWAYEAEDGHIPLFE